jgi:hypothetical protein
MTHYIRHRPTGSPQALIVSFHCRVGAEEIGDAPIASVEVAPYPVNATPTTIAAARALAKVGPNVPVGLVGFSAGCQPVRALVMAGAQPRAVATIDGTSSSWPVVNGAHVEAWRQLALEARRSERLWLATCTRQTYTETIPRTPQGGPYAATVTILERATGLELRGEGLAASREGDLVVESHPSKAIDATAHIAQAREVLPRLAADYLVPYLLDGVPDTLPAPPRPVFWPDVGRGEPTDTTIGQRACGWLGEQFGHDPREIPGPEHSPRILSYSENCRRGGRLLTVADVLAPSGLHYDALWRGGVALPAPSDEWPWCAMLQSAALLAALRPGERPPHSLRVSVRELVEDGRATDMLRGLDYSPLPGDLAIYRRAGGNPLTGGSGHVRAVLAHLEARMANMVGGNEGNRIQVGPSSLDDPDLVAYLARSEPVAP